MAKTNGNGGELVTVFYARPKHVKKNGIPVLKSEACVGCRAGNSKCCKDLKINPGGPNCEYADCSPSGASLEY